jgi:pilus assembly protein CpaF
LQLKKELHDRVMGGMELATLGTMDQEDFQSEVRRTAVELCRRSSHLLNEQEREKLVNEVLHETFGLGALEPLFDDPDVTDIMINGHKTVFVERKGKLQRTPIAFTDDRHVIRLIQRIASRVGRRCDETSPMVDARLADGSRFNAVIPPLCVDGPAVSIRRFGSKPLGIPELLEKQSITPEILDFLSGCVKARINMMVSGGNGSGKTTLLNVLSGFVPDDERVATIEDAAELQLQQSHVVRMETRPANVEGTGEVTPRDLVRNALRMRPDRIIIGECRGAEALDMLQAMNTGHEGSLTTLHANSPRDALGRLEMMVGMAGFDLPIWIIRRQIASSLQIVVQMARLKGGARKLVAVSEITGMDEEIISMHDIFLFNQTGVDQHGDAEGYYMSTGMRPLCTERLEASSIHLPTEMFERHVLKT